MRELEHKFLSRNSVVVNVAKDLGWTTVKSKRSWMPPDSWAFENKHLKFPDVASRWNGMTRPSPKWADEEASIKQVCNQMAFVGINDLKATHDVPLAKTIPAHVFTNYNQIELDAETDEFLRPTGLRISSRQKWRQQKPQSHTRPTIETVRTVIIPYHMIELISPTFELVEDLKLRPLMEERTSNTVYNCPHTKDNLTVSVKVSTDVSTQGRERYVHITTSKQGRGMELSSSIQVPWVHWPRFRWYFNKIYHEMQINYEEVQPSKPTTSTYSRPPASATYSRPPGPQRATPVKPSRPEASATSWK